MEPLTLGTVRRVVACTFIASLALSAGSVAQAPREAAIVSSSVALSGVRLGVTADVVIRRLGKPRRVTKLPPDTELGMGELQEFDYRGLKVGLNRPKAQRDFTVHELHVTSHRYRLSNGIAVGVPYGEVIKILGDTEGDHNQLVYLLSPGDGRLVITFKGAQVSLIELISEWS